MNSEPNEGSQQLTRRVVITSVSYAATAAVAIGVAVLGINWILAKKADLEITCQLRCLRNCALADIPGTTAPEGLPRRLYPGGPSCGEICDGACGRSQVSASAGGSGTSSRIFFDDFDSDVVGSPPSTSPAGDPFDDELIYSGAPGTVTVTNSGPLSSQAAKIARGSSGTSTVAEFVTGGGGPHTSGRYVIQWTAYTESAEATIAIVLLSSSGKLAFNLLMKDGQYGLTSGSGQEVLTGTYTNNLPHSFRFEVDMDAKTFSVSLDNSAYGPRPFIDGDYEDLRLVRLAYPPAVVEAFSGVYVIDNVVMERS